mgnify:CR=1
MNGCLDTVFPPASQGHNWNTVTVNPESCELMECVVKEYGWKMSGADLSLQEWISNRDFFDTARSFRDHYASFKSFIAFGISNSNLSQR